MTKKKLIKKVNDLRFKGMYAKRMYFFVMYNISEIQKGIQAGHAVEQYIKEFGHTSEYKDYIDNHKTWIVLNGGSSSNMKKIATSLMKNKIDHAIFKEPDLNNAISAVCFLLDERVFDMKKYPIPDHTDQYFIDSIGGKQNYFLKYLINGKKFA